MTKMNEKTTPATRKYLHVEEVCLLNNWRVCIRQPKHGDIRDDEGWVDPSRACYWRLYVDVFHNNGGEWEWQFSGSVRCDGCSNWNEWSYCLHFCGPEDTRLWQVIYDVTSKWMNVEEDE